MESNDIWALEEAFRIYGLRRESPYLPFKEFQNLANIKDRPMLDKAFDFLIKKNEKYDVEFRITNASDCKE